MPKQFQENDNPDTLDRFVVAEIQLADQSPMTHQTLADIKFRQKHGVTVVGIRRGEQQITTPGPAGRLESRDHLIVIGGAQKVETLKQKEPL